MKTTDSDKSKDPEAPPAPPVVKPQPPPEPTDHHGRRAQVAKRYGEVQQEVDRLARDLGAAEIRAAAANRRLEKLRGSYDSLTKERNSLWRKLKQSMKDHAGLKMARGK